MNQLVKYWRVSLFDTKNTQQSNHSVLSGMTGAVKGRPFFVGYSLGEPKICSSNEFLRLFTDELGGETRYIRMADISSVEVTPVYAEPGCEKSDSLLAAASPLIKWLNENCDLHSEVSVRPDGVSLISQEINIPCDQFIKD